MARGRMLNKTVCASLKFQELPDDTCRLLATWIIPHLDKNGVFYGDPMMVKSYVFPRREDVSAGDIERYLGAMADAGLVVLFEAKGDTWQHWPGFMDNQSGLRAERETTDFPLPAGTMPDDCRQDAGTVPEDSPQKRSESNIIEEKGSSATPDAIASPELQASEELPEPETPTTFDGWITLGKASKNKNAVIRQMFVVLYPSSDPPDYGYIGRVARKVGGWGRLIDLLWQNSTRPPTGDVLAYIQGIAKRGSDGNRNRAGTSTLGKPPISAANDPRTPEEAAELERVAAEVNRRNREREQQRKAGKLPVPGVSGSGMGS